MYKSLSVVFLSFIVQISIQASSFTSLFKSYQAEGFTDTEIANLFSEFKKEGASSQDQLSLLIYAIENPYAPAGSHAGEKFYEALSWYNDIVSGNKNGRFSLTELDIVFKEEAKKYFNLLVQEKFESDRVASWKMLQKLTLLKNEILYSGKNYYSYRAKELGQVDFNNGWNRTNTIRSRRDFNQRVIDASWSRPVLVKFGLTYCVHCLLMENLGSVPAVARKYEYELDVYKLWWNPKDQYSFGEFNQIAQEQGITSSPMFNLYINGRLVKSGYAFPDELGNGLEDFLAGYL